MNKLIALDRSILVAADVPDADDLYELGKALRGVQGIGGFKIGFEAALHEGLKAAGEAVKESFGETTLIFDMQKAGNDIPEIGAGFARIARRAGFDAVILFPFAGPATLEAWVKSCQDAGLTVLVGGEMTHEKFLVSEGGYIDENAPASIYTKACTLGVQHFVLPGNKPDKAKIYKSLISGMLGAGQYVLYGPGFVAQKGDITEFGREVGTFHAFVGRGICDHPTDAERRSAAEELVKKLS